MRIKCPNCAKLYELADDKLKGDGVKVRCTQCDQVFLVRPKAAPASTPRPASPGSTASGRAASGSGEDLSLFFGDGVAGGDAAGDSANLDALFGNEPPSRPSKPTTKPPAAKPRAQRDAEETIDTFFGGAAPATTGSGQGDDLFGQGDDDLFGKDDDLFGGGDGSGADLFGTSDDLFADEPKPAKPAAPKAPAAKATPPAPPPAAPASPPKAAPTAKPSAVDQLRRVAKPTAAPTDDEALDSLFDDSGSGAPQAAAPPPPPPPPPPAAKAAAPRATPPARPAGGAKPGARGAAPGSSVFDPAQRDLDSENKPEATAAAGGGSDESIMGFDKRAIPDFDWDEDGGGPDGLAFAPGIREQDAEQMLQRTVVSEDAGGRKRSPVAAVVVVLLLAAAAAAAVWFVPSLRAVVLGESDATTGAVKRKSPPKPALPVKAVGEPRTSMVENRKGIAIFVVEGTVENGDTVPHSFVRVHVGLKDAAGATVTESTVFAGNNLTELQLKTFPPAELLRQLQVEMGSGLKNFNIGPGETVPFMAIYAPAPTEATDLRPFVEVVSSYRGEQR